jgi:hypothetical protein
VGDHIVYCKDCGKLITRYSLESQENLARNDCVKHITCSECYRPEVIKGDAKSHFTTLNMKYYSGVRNTKPEANGSMYEYYMTLADKL